MTVQTIIMNCGNNPHDKVHLHLDHKGSNDPELPNFISLDQGKYITMDDSIKYDTIKHIHGSGEVLNHIPMAVVAEGPGAKMVRVDFNPSANSDVDRIKKLAAALINEIHAKGLNPRLTAMAKSAFEEGAMWAVKSLTAPQV